MPVWLQWVMPIGGLVLFMFGVVLLIASLPYVIGGGVMIVGITLLFVGFYPMNGPREKDATGRR